MQYLITEEEMAAIRKERITILMKLNGGLDRHVEGLENVCKYVATQMAEVGGRLVNGRTPSNEPHGCIHVPDERGTRWNTRYCDNCPVAGICPLDKNWSK